MGNSRHEMGGQESIVEYNQLSKKDYRHDESTFKLKLRWT
jgi:hypothetical protein